jgi:hypothetical protein
MCRPGRRRAGSIESGRLVAPMITTCGTHITPCCIQHNERHATPSTLVLLGGFKYPAERSRGCAACVAYRALSPYGALHRRRCIVGYMSSVACCMLRRVQRGCLAELVDAVNEREQRRDDRVVVLVLLARPHRRQPVQLCSIMAACIIVCAL